jgi:hypothetical protein
MCGEGCKLCYRITDGDWDYNAPEVCKYCLAKLEDCESDHDEEEMLLMGEEDNDADLLSRILFPRGIEETPIENVSIQIVPQEIVEYFDKTVLPQLLAVHTSAVERLKQFNYVLDKAKRGTKSRKITVESRIYNDGTRGVDRTEYRFRNGVWDLTGGGSWYNNLYGNYHYSGGRANPTKLNISQFVVGSSRTRCGIEILGACPQVDKSGKWVYSHRDRFMSVAEFKEACQKNGIKPKVGWKKLDYAIALMKL